MQQSVRHAIREALTFLWYGQLSHSGKVMKAWSQVRKMIKGTIIKEHARVLRMDDQDRQTRRYTHTRNKHAHTHQHADQLHAYQHRFPNLNTKMIGKQVDKHKDQPHMQGPLYQPMSWMA